MILFSSYLALTFSPNSSSPISTPRWNNFVDSHADHLHTHKCMYVGACTHTHTHTHTHMHDYTYIHVWEVLIIVWPNRIIYAFFPHCLLCFFFSSFPAVLNCLKLQPSLSTTLSPAYFLILYYLAAMAHIFILLELKGYWNKVLSYKTTLLHPQPGL